MRSIRYIIRIGVLCLVGALCMDATAASFTWDGGSGNWSDNNWSGGSPPPSAGDQATINVGTVLLSSASPYLGSFTQGGGSLVFTNWTTSLSATNVDLTGGTVDLPAAFNDTTDMSNRVWFVCSNFFLGASATIDGDGAGYGRPTGANAAGYGPGKGGFRAGGGYGGFGGNFAKLGGRPYGSAAAPTDPGSGGGPTSTSGGGQGGGVVRGQIAGTVTVNGTITANGGVASANCGGGSGGTVYLTCNKIVGSSGIIRANGGNGNSSSGRGAGGRIAVVYNTAAQAAELIPNISYSVLPGTVGTVPADIGTLYFSDNRFLTDTISGLNGSLPAATSWSPDSFTLNNCQLRFANTNFRLYVTNDIIITGNSAQLELAAGALLTNGTLRQAGTSEHIVYSETTNSVYCGGDLSLLSGGTALFFSGPTNGASTNYGAIVEVAGNITIASNSVLSTISHPTDGGCVFIKARNMTIDLGGSISADNYGYTGGSTTLASDYGFGPGGGGSRSSGGYGGAGNYTFAGQAYGSSNAPVQCGSGGGSYGVLSVGGGGGGLIWVEVTKTLILNGSMDASGKAPASHAGAGSGGGIYLSCNGLEGSGSLTTVGGVAPGTGGSGGGGRIAIWRRYDNSAGISTDASGGTHATYPGEDGTVVWGWLPIIYGTIITVR